MIELYIDESGSMTKKNTERLPYFVISVLRVFDKDKLKRRFKRFISKNYHELKSIDSDSKIFKNGKFHELKGSSLTKEMKIKFANFICKDNLFEIYYIKINNALVDENLYDNTARAFNYILGLDLEHNIHKKNYPIKENYILSIDERNVKTEAANTLEDYLNIKFKLDLKLINSISVSYFDSSNNILIQLSDFFSNLYYSYLMTGDSYKKIFEKMKKEKYIKNYFEFPKK